MVSSTSRLASSARSISSPRTTSASFPFPLCLRLLPSGTSPINTLSLSTTRPAEDEAEPAELALASESNRSDLLGCSGGSLGVGCEMSSPEGVISSPFGRPDRDPASRAVVSGRGREEALDDGGCEDLIRLLDDDSLRSSNKGVERKIKSQLAYLADETDD